MPQLHPWVTFAMQLLLGLTFVFTVLLIHQRFPTATGTWTRILNSLDSRYGPQPPPGAPRRTERLRPWIGVIEGVSVTVDTVQPGEGEGVTGHLRVRVSGLPHGVSIRSEHALSQLTQALVGADVRTGDPTFDRAVHLRGPAIPTLARCGHAHRATTLAAVQLGATASRGYWAWYWPDTYIDQDQLHRVIHTLVADARLWLPDDASIEERLEQLVLRDPVDGVRARALVALLTTGGVEGALPTARAALGDAAWEDWLRPEAANADTISFGLAAAVCAAAAGTARHTPGLRAWEAMAPPEVKPAFSQLIATLHAAVDPEHRGALSVASVAEAGDLSPAAARGELGKVRTS